jgi:hypothetical protein
MPFFMWFVVEDAKGDKSTVEIPIPSTVALAGLAPAVVGMADLISDMMTGQILRAGVTLDVDISSLGLPAIAGALSDVQEKAAFIFRTVGGYLKRVTLPTIDEGIFAAGSREVDLTNASVAAFVTAMEDGYLAGGEDIDPCDYRGDDIDALTDAREAWGRARR